MAKNIRDCIRKKNWWYRNCKIQRKKKSKICLECPIRDEIERIEKEENA